MRRLGSVRLLRSVAVVSCAGLATPALADRGACERAEVARLHRILGGRIIDTAQPPTAEDPAGGERSECLVLADGWRAVVTFVDLGYIRNVRKLMRAEVIAARMNSQLITLTVEQPRRADELIRAEAGPKKLSFTAAFSYRVATIVIDQLPTPLPPARQAQLREYAELMALQR